MTVRSVLKVAEKFIVDNSPSLLTGVAVTGTLTTAFLTGKASFKAAEIIRDEQERINLEELKPKDLETSDKVKLVWKEFIPPAGMALTTVACIIGANQINSSRMAGLAAAYKLSEKQISEYKEKVLERLGPRDERKLREELAQDQINRKPVQPYEVVGSGEAICFDQYTGRYFMADMETIKQAVNNTNYKVIHHSHATLTDFYDKVGLDGTAMSEEVGWNIETGLLEIHITTALTKSGKPCLSVEFVVPPVPIRGFVHA